MNNKKIKILEISILIVIIISIIIILLFALKAFEQKPQESNSNNIKDYSVTRIHKYQTDISNSYKYQIPYTNLIDNIYSNYNIYITSTDNLIHTLNETIIIRYPILNPEEETFIKNYCNTYDNIELEYKLQCTYNQNILTIKHQFNIDKLNNQDINHNNLTISIPIKKNTRLNEHLEYLNSINIYPQQVDKIS